MNDKRPHRLASVLAAVLLSSLVLSCQGQDGDPALADSVGEQSGSGLDFGSWIEPPDSRSPPKDLASDESNADSLPETVVTPCSEQVPLPPGKLWPIPGELFYVQVGLSGFSMGESALVIGPDGTIVWIDAGNDSHDDDIRATMNKFVAQMNETPGFPERKPNSVDHLVVTHFHSDHADGVQDLLDKGTITGRVIHRGLFDITGGTGVYTVEKLCNAFAAYPELSSRLCQGPEEAPCDPEAFEGTYPSTHCNGLDAGDLDVDGDAGPTRISFGGESGLVLVGANGCMAGDDFEDFEGPLDAKESNGENARSVVGILRHGDFRLLFGGDLTGGGNGTDDVEGFYADRLHLVSDIDELGVDVLHAGHHGRKTSSSPTWLDRLLPNDGLDRNGETGISSAHGGSPEFEVLEGFLSNNRLGDGRFWVTTVAPGGATHSDLVDAQGGLILVSTLGGGTSYIIQAMAKNGKILETRTYHTVRHCPDGIR